MNNPVTETAFTPGPSPKGRGKIGVEPAWREVLAPRVDFILRTAGAVAKLLGSWGDCRGRRKGDRGTRGFSAPPEQISGVPANPSADKFGRGEQLPVPRVHAVRPLC